MGEDAIGEDAIICHGIDKSEISRWWQKWYSLRNLIKVIFSVFFCDISDNLHDKSDISNKIFDKSDIFPIYLCLILGQETYIGLSI